MDMCKGIAGVVALCFCISVNASIDSQMEPEMRTQASKKVHWCKHAKKNNLKQVQILSINDFHGQISSGKKVSGRAVGSAPVLVSYLKEEQEKFNGKTFFVHAGDLIGASAPQSSMLQDEPTIMIMNTLKDTSTSRPSRKHTISDNIVGIPGNHEFDEGTDEFFRLINGGNHKNGPFLENVYKGADFPYICSNITFEKTGKTILPPYIIRKVDNVKIAFIGATIKETPSIVTPAGVAGLVFNDEVEAINKTVKMLNKLNIHAIVVVIHQGGVQTAYDGVTNPEATQVSGAIVDIVRKLDDDVDVVISGHYHGFTNALLPNDNGSKILVAQAWSSGTAYGDIELEIDRKTNDIVSKSAQIRTTWADTAFTLTPDPKASEIVKAAEERLAPIINRSIATASDDILRAQNAAGESALGNLIADAQRAAMGTDFAMTGPGGIRADLYTGEVTWGDLYEIQPFNNNLVKLELTGQQIYDVLNQQWYNQQSARILQVSGLSYTWSSARPLNDRVIEVLKDGVPIDINATYSVTVNGFLATGGDRFTVFTQGQNRVVGPLDLDALVNYAQKLSQPFSAAVDGRISGQ
jgi:5'-nucleotidase